jgi:hypothetical protein
MLQKTFIAFADWQYRFLLIPFAVLLFSLPALADTSTERIIVAEGKPLERTDGIGEPNSLERTAPIGNSSFQENLSVKESSPPNGATNIPLSLSSLVLTISGQTIVGTPAAYLYEMTSSGQYSYVRSLNVVWQLPELVIGIDGDLSASTTYRVVVRGETNQAVLGKSGSVDSVNYFIYTTSFSTVVEVNGSCGLANGADASVAPTTNLCSSGAPSSVGGNGPWNWSCAGSNGGSTATCTDFLIVNGSCGSANGADVLNAPTTNLCSSGTPSSVGGNGPWNWSCSGSNGGSTASCSDVLIVNGSCGPANGADASVAPTTNLCSSGTPSSVGGNGPWSWSCSGSNGGSTASCSDVLIVNGSCGPANGADASVAPTTNLCSSGTPSSVGGNGPWSWSCAGSNGGTTASCSDLFMTNGSCGPANGADASVAPTTNLCSSGTPSSVGGNGPWSWSCAGSNGGTTASCSDLFMTNGSCGPANGANASVAPTTNLCSSGTPSSVGGNGPWSWSCAGSNGGSSASCSDFLIVNGSCGSSNGAAASVAPTTNLCTTGTPSTVGGSGPWSWNCAGSNTGSTAACTDWYVPSTYLTTYNNALSSIGTFQTTINQSWNGSPSPVTWAPHLLSAESDAYTALLSPNYYQNSVLPELQEIQATGATAVTVHISFPILYQPYYTYIGDTTNLFGQFESFYQQLINEVHARGMKLVVEAAVTENLDGTSGGTSFQPYYQTLNWTQYMSGRAQNAVNVAQLIGPDYLSVVTEPDTEANDASQPTENTPAGALALLQTQLTALQQANVTNVPIGAGAGTWITDTQGTNNFTSYIQDYAGTSVNYIDMHVYMVMGQYDLSNIIAAASIAQQYHKLLGMSETWPDKTTTAENINETDALDVFSFWSPVDTAFLQSLVDVAQWQQFTFVSPSYPDFFAAYLDYNYYNNLGEADPTNPTDDSILIPAEEDAGLTANRVGTFTTVGQAFSTMIVGADITPPATPAAPTYANLSETGLQLDWTLTTDNVGVAGYNIFRNNSLIATLALPPYSDAGNLSPGTTYSYTINAFDAQGNVSPISQPLTVTTYGH